MKLELLLIVLASLFMSCSTSLSDDPLIADIFSEDETMFLESLLTYFDEEVQLQTSGGTIESSYSIWFSQVKDSVKAQNAYAPFLKMDYQKLARILQSTDESIQKEIWYSGVTISPATGDSTRYVNLHPFGKYGLFLEAAGSENPFIKNYFRDLQHINDISPFMEQDMLRKPEELEISQARNRLVYAIHFITFIRRANS